MYNMVLFTIGVYESTEESFFKTLIDNKIDTFCDIRQRRGVRGSKYSYVNSIYLQNKLAELGIKYRYIKDLAPTNEIRQMQKEADKDNHIDKKSRTELGMVFKLEYTKQILNNYDIDSLISDLQINGAQNVVFFCVEKSASACHRSIVTARIANKYGYKLNHL